MKEWETANAETEWLGTFSGCYERNNQLADLLRMAYGNTDKNTRYVPLLLLVCILTVVAYISLFYARSLFEWQKKWPFDIKNAENLEPSEWHFVKNKTVGVGFLLLAFWLWLVVMGIWQGNG